MLCYGYITCYLEVGYVIWHCYRVFESEGFGDFDRGARLYTVEQVNQCEIAAAYDQVFIGMKLT